MKTASRIAGIATVAAGLLGYGSVASAAPEGSETKKLGVPQVTCPVMGGKINKKLFLDVNGKRIYVCCEGCIGALKNDPQKYVKELEADGVAIETVGVPQTTCPVMGGKINKKLFVDVDGKRIYVCCGGCIGAIRKEPQKYIKKLADQGVAIEEAPKAALK